MTRVQDIDGFQCHLFEAWDVSRVRFLPVGTVAPVQVVLVDVAIKPDW